MGAEPVAAVDSSVDLEDVVSDAMSGLRLVLSYSSKPQ